MEAVGKEANCDVNSLAQYITRIAVICLSTLLARLMHMIYGTFYTKMGLVDFIL